MAGSSAPVVLLPNAFRHHRMHAPCSPHGGLACASMETPYTPRRSWDRSRSAASKLNRSISAIEAEGHSGQNVDRSGRKRCTHIRWPGCRRCGTGRRRGAGRSLVFAGGGDCTTVSAARRPSDVQRLLRMRPDLVPRFGDERCARLGHERLTHLLFRPERSVDQTDHELGQPSGPAAAPSAAVHPTHQLLAGIDASLNGRRSAMRPHSPFVRSSQGCMPSASARLRCSATPAGSVR